MASPWHPRGIIASVDVGRGKPNVLFMVIETFRNADARSVYARFRERGRMTPAGLEFVGSWVAADLGRCFQIMDCDDVALLQEWVARWSDLIDFEIVPVEPGARTAALLAE